MYLNHSLTAIRGFGYIQAEYLAQVRKDGQVDVISGLKFTSVPVYAQ